MTTAEQQDALTQSAKQVFAEVMAEKVDALDETSITMMEEAVAAAIKDTLVHIQNEFGVAIAFYIAHDFQRASNSNPDSPFKMDLSFEYAPNTDMN